MINIDYLVLVNKQHPLPPGWEENLKTVAFRNSVGEEIEVETQTAEAFRSLASALERDERIHIELDSGLRSVREQQEILDRHIAKYGEERAGRTVAMPGYSEHHTGLAIDLYFITEQGTTVYTNEDLTKAEYDGIWETIHRRMPEYGFILRYPRGRENITGYSYEPWHLRYVGSPGTAREITEQGITLEEYREAAAAAKDFSHFNDQGRARMVNVGEKAPSHRTAAAAGRVRISRETLGLIRSGGMKKGDVLTVAQIAGIMAAKHTPDWIPMCHPVPLNGIDLRLRLNEEDPSVEIEATVQCDGKTGVEMEALTAVSGAALTVYDMCKAVQKDMVIDDIRLLSKTGGVHGDYRREE